MTTKEHRAPLKESEQQPTTQPSRKRRALLVGGPLLAVAVAGGLYAGLKPSHSPDNESAPKGATPAATSTPNKPVAENTPSTAPSGTLTNGANSAPLPLKSLCTTIPAEVVASSLGGNTSCSTTDRDNQSVTLFAPFDLAHAEWGGPEGEANEVIVTIRPSFMEQYGGDQFKIAQQANSSSDPEDITVLGYPGIYVPEQDLTVSNGIQVRTEIEIIKAGPYLVSLFTEQPDESAPSQAETTHLAEAIIQHALPQS